MNIRQYFKNVSLLFIVNFTIKPIWVFGIERKFHLLLGNELYGSYFSYLSLIYILSVFLDIGLHNYAVKFISNKKDSYKEYLSELWMSKFILIGVYTILVIAFVFIKEMSLEGAIIFSLIAFQMLLFSIYQFLRCFVQGLQMLKLDSILSSLDRLFLVIIGLALLLLYVPNFKFELEDFIGFHILAFVLAIIVVWVLLKDKVSIKLKSFSVSQLKTIVKDGYLLIFVTLIMSIYTRIDVILLEQLLVDGKAQCGSFALSHRIIDSAYNSLALLSVFLLPTVAFHFTEKKYDYIRKIMFYSFIASTVLSLGFICLCLFGADKIYALLYPISKSIDVEVFKIHLWTVLGIGWMYVFGSYLTAIGKFKMLLIIVTIGLFISLGLNFQLIPIHKALGAVTAASVVQLSMGVLHMMGASYYLFKYKDDESHN